jgi:putative NADH-flavin reductase
VRDPARLAFADDRLTVAQGDVLQPASLNGSIDGSDAVVSALGPASGRAPTTVYSDGAKNVLAAMRYAGVRRFVAVSAIPVAPPAEIDGLLTRRVLVPLLYRFIGETYADMARMEEMLRASSDIDWTVVRSPRLTNGNATGRYRTAINEMLPHAGKISRADLADWLLRLAGDRRSVGAVVTAAY